MRATLRDPGGIVWPAEMRVVYWAERDARNWWGGLSHDCPRQHCGGYLAVVPPDAGRLGGPGAVVCMSCSRETATVEERRPRTLTAEQFGELPTQQGRRSAR